MKVTDTKKSKDGSKVTAVVLNWNNYPDTAACIESLNELTYENVEIVVVDNGSTDGSGNRLADAYPDVEVIFTGENLGFGAGMNVGIERALATGTEYVWIINNDSLFSERTVLTELVGKMEANPDIGVISPRVYCYPDTDELWFERGHIDDRTYNAIHEHNTGRLLDLRFDRPSKKSDPQDGMIESDYVPLCSALIDSDVLASVGLLPEYYFLYYEDADYCQRVTEAGYRVTTLRSSGAYHKAGGSSDGNATMTYYIERNRFVFARRRGSPGVEFVLLSVWRFLLPLLYNLALRNFETVRAHVLGTIDGTRNKAGRGPYP